MEDNFFYLKRKQSMLGKQGRWLLLLFLWALYERQMKSIESGAVVGGWVACSVFVNDGE